MTSNYDGKERYMKSVRGWLGVVMAAGIFVLAGGVALGQEPVGVGADWLIAGQQDHGGFNEPLATGARDSSTEIEAALHNSNSPKRSAGE